MMHQDTWNTVECSQRFFQALCTYLYTTGNSDKAQTSLRCRQTFDVLGWFSPSTIKAKILMQQLWELKMEWDDPVPEEIHDAWL